MKDLRSKTRIGLLFAALSGVVFFTSCSDDDLPEAENETEIITDAVLTFTGGGEVITASAKDPDGEGLKDIVVLNDIELKPETEYVLTIALENSVEGESITEEVQEESDEHQFFFEFTEGIFSSPAGSGNILDLDGSVNYSDKDDAGLPVGLETSWTTATAQEGTFRVVLRHQPDVKSETSDYSYGETDLDLTWTIKIAE